jgi:hypothetical protein
MGASKHSTTELDSPAHKLTSSTATSIFLFNLNFEYDILTYIKDETQKHRERAHVESHLSVLFYTQ